MNPDTVSIAASGLTFTADVAGPEDGDVALLLHGFPQTRHTWRRELDVLADAGYRACAPDQRGYSAGARPGGIADYQMEHLVAGAMRASDNGLGDHRRRIFRFSRLLSIEDVVANGRLTDEGRRRLLRLLSPFGSTTFVKGDADHARRYDAMRREMIDGADVCLAIGGDESSTGMAAERGLAHAPP